MKRLLAFGLLFVTVMAYAAAPVIWGPNNVALSLETGGLKFGASGPGTYFGNLDPSITAVDAVAGSTYGSSLTGKLYVKQDNGSSTNWLDTLLPTTGWTLNGNAGTNDAVNFLGTTDAQGVVIKTNAAERARFLSSGELGVGVTPTAGVNTTINTAGDGTKMLLGNHFSFGDNSTTSILSGGASVDNLGVWTANGTGAASMLFNGVGFDGGFNFYTDSGLVIGNTFSPTLRMLLSPSGNLGINASVPGNVDTTPFRLQVQQNTSDLQAGAAYLSNQTHTTATNAWTNTAINAESKVLIDAGQSTSANAGVLFSAYRNSGATDFGSLDFLAGAFGGANQISTDAGATTNVVAGVLTQNQVTSGIATNMYDFYAMPGQLTGGTVTNRYGLYVSPDDIGTKLNFMSGRTRLSQNYSSPTATLDIYGDYTQSYSVTPTDSTGTNTHQISIFADPVASTSNASLQSMNVSMVYDNGNTGFDLTTGTLSSISAATTPNGTGTVNYVEGISNNSNFPSVAGHTLLYKGINSNSGVGAGYTVDDYNQIGSYFNSTGGATIQTSKLYDGNAQLDNVTGQNHALFSGNSNIGGASSLSGNATAINASIYAKDTATVSTLQGGSVSIVAQDSAAVTDMRGFGVYATINNTASVTGTYQVAQFIGNSTPTLTAATGVSIDVQNVPVADPFDKTALSVQGGSFEASYNFDILPADTFFQAHFLGGSPHVASGSPVSSFGFGLNLSQSVTFDDDWTADFTGLRLGFVNVGMVGQVVGSGSKTMDSWTGVLAGFGNPSGAGYVDQAVMFRAAGGLNQGGSITVNNMYGFLGMTTLCSTVTGGGNCWGLKIEDSAADNSLAKNLAIGVTQTSNSSVGLELNSTTQAFLPSRLTTAQRNALTPLQGMMIQNTTTGTMQYYNGSTWVDMSASGTPVAMTPVTKTVTSTLTSTEVLVRINGAPIITLSAASGVTGIPVYLKNISTTVTQISSPDLMDGMSAFYLEPKGARILISNGVTYDIH